MIGSDRLDVVENWRRLAILGVVVAVLALAIVANGTMKRHRVAARTAPQAAVAFVHPTAGAQSAAWYCPGPLPLGLKKEQSSLVIANASTSKVAGQLLVSTSTGLSLPRAISIPSLSTSVFPLPALPHSSFGAASVLVNGSGIGVEEIIDGPTGREAAPCAGETSTVAYLAGGSTKGTSGLTLSVYDPGATPAVANISFATSSGPVSPLAFQGLPIAAGHVVVVDVGQAVAQREVVAATVNATGGRVVVGAIERAAIGTVTFPALVSANNVAESNWYLPALPAGGTTLGFVYALNPGNSTIDATVQVEGTGEDGEATLAIPPNSVARLTENPSPSPSALRSVVVHTAASAPIVVLGSGLLVHRLVEPKVTTPTPAKAPTIPAKGAKRPVHQIAPAPGAVASPLPTKLLGLPTVVPIGYALSAATVSADDWLLPGGANDGKHGEFVTVTNPGQVPATVSLETLGGGSATEIPGLGSLTLAAGQSIVVDLARVLAPASSVTVMASADAPVVVGAGLYAKGSKGSIGLTDSVAIPLD